jgi:hypothetical protein
MTQQIQTAISAWEQPIPFRNMDLPMFPIDELPMYVKNYACEVAETTQTSIDMSGVASLAILALCIQGKFRIKGKQNWIEPLNLYTLVVAPPAERKSAVVSLMSEPIKEYENSENERLAPSIEQSKIEKQILQNRKKALESKAAKNPGDYSLEIQALSEEISEFKEIKPCRLFCDDITPEKLTGVLSDNHGRAAILSAEGGIFDIMAGRYAGSSNIDVFLKAHAGDSIRVDRQSRQSEYIKNPAMTTLIFSQPSVMGSLMENSTFQGRGLCARFLYSIPTSTVGKRKFGSNPITEATAASYHNIINLLLNYNPDEPRIISLAPEAYKLLEAYAEKFEPMLKDELSDIADWAGKFIGTVLRIAGLLYIADCMPLNDTDILTVPKNIMQNAIIIGEYFLEHAKAAYQMMGADETAEHCRYILRQMQKSPSENIGLRDIMRFCRKFKTAEQALIPINRLCEYDYLREAQTEYSGKGRPQTKTWEVNPKAYNVKI